MKEAAFPASRVTMSKTEKGGGRGRERVKQGDLVWEMAKRQRENGEGKGGFAGAWEILFHITSELWNFLCSGGALQSRAGL